MDLFGVFNEDPAASDEPEIISSPSANSGVSLTESASKVSNEPTPELVDETPVAQEQVPVAEPDVPSTKKRKLNQIRAIVTDSFETEAVRKVSNAGETLASPTDDEDNDKGSDKTTKTANGAEQQLVLSHQVRHQVALPLDYDYVPISQQPRSKDPARTYPFELDPFQDVSIRSIERNESVLVSAHTSAGKTVVAEYAIAQCLRNKQRVIYTSPIKALSNQKFRDLQAEFEDVGLMTGDVSINPDASCLVMTTEILRSMLYRGSEVVREVGWVIFDEIHYMRDKERGVVWEESIILLPDTVRFVFLSATIPNAMQFAEWVCKTHNQPCHVVYTNFRPTPLQHYLFPKGGDGIYLVVDEKRHFREANFNKAMQYLKASTDDDDNKLGKSQKKKKVFTSVRKFDGTNNRWISGGEYIQMSGRAGRRGLDDRGIVIMMVDEEMEPSVAMGMVKGESDKLNSAFYLSYTMILNLLRVEGITPEFILEQSFHQFQNQESIPVFEDKIEELEKRISEYKIEDEEHVSQYYTMRQQQVEFAEKIRNIITLPENVLSFLNLGRIIHVNINGTDFGWGVVLRTYKRPAVEALKLSQAAKGPRPPQQDVIIDVLLCISESSEIDKQKKGSTILHPSIKPAPANSTKATMETLTITLESLYEICSLCVFVPKELTSRPQRNSVKKSIDEIKQRFPDGLPLLDPIENMKIVGKTEDDNEFFTILRKVEVLETLLYANPLHGNSDLPRLYNLYVEKDSLEREKAYLRKRLMGVQSAVQLEELRSMKRVLRQLNYTTIDDVVELKGRVACEISSGNELVLTELLFAGEFNDFEPEECAALLSTFVFDGRSKEIPVLPLNLKRGHDAVLAAAKAVVKVTKACKLEIDAAAYLDKFKVNLILAVLQWCKGATFTRICKMTDIFEGNIVMVLRRLGELLREVQNAARVMGNTDLEAKMAKALEMVNRDVVSTPSLYL